MTIEIIIYYIISIIMTYFRSLQIVTVSIRMAGIKWDLTGLDRNFWRVCSNKIKIMLVI